MQINRRFLKIFIVFQNISKFCYGFERGGGYNKGVIKSSLKEFRFILFRKLISKHAVSGILTGDGGGMSRQNGRGGKRSSEHYRIRAEKMPPATAKEEEEEEEEAHGLRRVFLLPPAGPRGAAPETCTSTRANTNARYDIYCRQSPVARIVGAGTSKSVPYSVGRGFNPAAFVFVPPKRCHCEERSDAAIRFPAFDLAAPKRRFNR